MLIYTIQPPEFYDELVETGYVMGKKERATIYEDCEAIEIAYNWMAQKLSKHVKRTFPQDFSPVWVWAQKPDLRKCGCRQWGEKGSAWLVLTFDVDESEVLWSDFEAWHSVMMHRPVELFEGEKVDTVASWSRIFDFDQLSASEWWYKGSSETLQERKQGVVEKVIYTQLVGIRRFVSR